MVEAAVANSIDNDVSVPIVQYTTIQYDQNTDDTDTDLTSKIPKDSWSLNIISVFFLGVCVYLTINAIGSSPDYIFHILPSYPRIYYLLSTFIYIS